jgi:LysR family transcriptional regulator, mexEF-oprN operon transcriptional activator
MRNMQDNYGRDLDLNLLRVFVAIADAGSVTGAAARLYLTQPAISAALRRLTEAVGTPLFVRHGRGVVLSKPGERMLAAVRPHLEALLIAALSPPRFDPKTSEHVIRIGLSDTTEGWILPALLRALAVKAPKMAVVATSVQFRTVAEALTSRRVDLALSVLDEVPPNVQREALFKGGFVCLYDPRKVKLGRAIGERAYFAHEHVIVSYNGDLRGIVEDLVGKSRKVRCSLNSFSHVGDVLEGTALLATVPQTVARQLMRVRPKLRTATLPFSMSGTPIELLWPNAVHEDEASRFVRQLLRGVIAAELAGKRWGEGRPKERRRPRGSAGW